MWNVEREVYVRNENDYHILLSLGKGSIAAWDFYFDAESGIEGAIETDVEKTGANADVKIKGNDLLSYIAKRWKSGIGAANACIDPEKVYVIVGYDMSLS